MNRPAFSILHTTARVPDGWINSYREWKQSAADPASFEYILSVDAGEEDNVLAAMFQHGIHEASIKLVMNHGARSCVAGWNRAAEVSQGQVLIMNSDDMFPPPNWDWELLAAIQQCRYVTSSDFTVHVSTGSPRDLELMTLPILSAARYHRLGYVFWPEYPSMFSDDEFTAHAYKDRTVVKALFLQFRHDHPVFGRSAVDAVYKRQNEEAKYAAGETIFERRKAAGFPPLPWRGGGSIQTSATRARIALLLPGAQFSARWVMNLLGLLSDLEKSGYEVIPPINGYSSDPGITRETLLRALRDSDPKPDYVLWCDDDNVINSRDVGKLMLDLDTMPDVAAVFAWCWIQPDGYEGAPPRVSCGRVDRETGLGIPFTPQEMYDQAKAGNLMTVGHSGFPAVLMRWKLLKEIGDNPFCPLTGPQYHCGRSGEDFAFCQRAIEKGFTLAVDPQVKIPHLKVGSHEPDLSKFIQLDPPQSEEETIAPQSFASAAD
jgi:GT2 family glycosyltransferase